MKPKHTPGPWTTGQTAGLRKVIIDRQNNTVCKVALDGDTALISAAPDLLEALELALKGLAGPYSDGNIGLSTRDLLVKEIESAIKKARGES